MNNLTNYHSHCDFCDGHAPMELFVREAVKEGFSSYGISSHAPFPVQNGCNMQTFAQQTVVAAVQNISGFREKET